MQSAKSAIHLTRLDFRPRWQLFSRILKVALLSSLQILVSNVALIAITAYVAHFGIEALAGYGLAARVELLISSMMLALGVGTTTMVGTCVGAGLEARARRVTLVSCLLAAAIFAAIGLALRFREDRSQVFLRMPKELSLRHPAISTRRAWFTGLWPHL
ncbi:MATE family efflux transporter [Bradyrhizobium sp. RDT10]